MKLIMYFYKSTSGCLMPAVSDKTLAELKQDFKDSITPLGKIFCLHSRREALLCVALLEAQLTHMPETETGLRYNINVCIEELKNLS